MGVSVNGNHITITGATIEIINGANDESGVSYIIITPDGGVGVLPFMAQGLPGQPALYDTITLVQHPHGEALPTPNPVKTLVDPGGPGLPARYNLEFHLNAGPTGDTGSPSISGASDLAAAPVLGEGTNGYILAYRHADGKFVLMAQKIGNLYTPGAVIAATGPATNSPRLLSTINIPALSYEYIGIPYAATVTAGTGGATPTHH